MSSSQTPIGDRRTFLRPRPLAFGGPTVGDWRTFSSEWATCDGLGKPSNGTLFSADKATLQSTLCLKQSGERASAHLLLKISREVTDRRSGPDERDDSGEKETLAVETA